MMFSIENEIEKCISDELQHYAQKEYSSHLASLMLSRHTSSHMSISIDSMSLFESNITFAHYMFQNPRRALKLLDNAFQKVSSEITKTHALKADMIYKDNLHVRLIALPNLPEVYRSNLPNCSDVGQFLCISGTVIRASTAKMLEYKKLWRCSKCKYQFIVEAEVELGYVCEKPTVCRNPISCNGKNFLLMSNDINTEWCKNYQEIKLQEQVYNLNVGTVPRSMLIILEDDLVELCHPGNDVIVSGVLIQQWKPLSRGMPIEINLLILAHNIEVQNKMSTGIVSIDMAREFGQFWQNYQSDPLCGRNFILSSICPQVFGMYIVKLAVALVLAGGVQKKSGSSRIRGESHLLLIGDPGTAKSQFLKFATKVSSRSVFTSGIGTTNAGLTVSAVKESGRWQLEAGALVLADGGICCIDEFSCIKEQDKTCMHEAMEQQTISVAKAGLVCSLNTRCSILAATNPKGKYDENLSISENTALGSPLLSRFDIILVLLDSYDDQWDDMVASFIFDGRNVLNRNSSESWSITKVKSYFTLIRHINPKLTEDAERVLRTYFTKQRSLQSRSAARTTPRLLQSLIRLAEGHARLMFRKEVLVSDAVIAIILIESSMLGNSILEGLKPLHTVFPTNTADEYMNNAEKVFQNLNLELPLRENYERFYQESTLKNLLTDISGVWISKDDPYIFGTPCNEPSTSDVFPDSAVVGSEVTTIEPDCGISENPDDELRHKMPYGVNLETEQSLILHTVNDVLQRDVSTPQIAHQVSHNEITTFSDLRNICDISDSAASETECNSYVGKNSNNLSILQEILDEPDPCNEAKFPNVKCNDILGSKHIVNSVSSGGNASTDSVVITRNVSSKDFNITSQNTTNSNCLRSNVDVLEELGISSDRTLEKGNDNVATTAMQSSISTSNKSASLNIFPPKRSFADQLKNFAFSKPGFSLQQNFLHNKASTSCDKAQKDSNLNSIALETEKNKPETKLNVMKNTAFKMIVDKSRSSQSETISQNVSVHLFHSSENFNASSSSNNNQSVKEITKATSSKTCQSEVNCFNSGDCATAEQSHISYDKGAQFNKLKMFAFSKRKISKTEIANNNENSDKVSHS